MARQHRRSISGVALTSVEFHHFVHRSASGIGYEWNIIALTPEEHRAVHDHKPIKVNGRERYTPAEFDTLMRNHLILNYDGWTVEKCKYHKYWSEEDYGIKKREKL